MDIKTVTLNPKTMKKYNSVYTVAITIDHDKEDASDVTQEMLIERLYPLSFLTFDGPDDTYENEQ